MGWVVPWCLFKMEKLCCFVYWPHKKKVNIIIFVILNINFDQKMDVSIASFGHFKFKAPTLVINMLLFGVFNAKNVLWNWYFEIDIWRLWNWPLNSERGRFCFTCDHILANLYDTSPTPQHLHSFGSESY